MSASGTRAALGQSPGSDRPPELSFSVRTSEAVRHAATPMVGLRVRVESPDDRAIRSVMLAVQVQIAPGRRPYGEHERELLVELFGPPGEWGRNMHALLWARPTVLLPAFAGETEVEVLLPCTYELQFAAAAYVNALADGTIPLELLFSGTVFYSSAAGQLLTAMIPASAEATHELAVATWRAAIERHFPGFAWLRLERGSLDRLAAYKARHALPTWECALEQLLAVEETRG